MKPTLNKQLMRQKRIQCLSHSDSQSRNQLTMLLRFCLRRWCYGKAIAIASLLFAIVATSPALAQSTAGICSRTEAVRDEILYSIPGVSDCADVTDAHLSAITGFIQINSRSASTAAFTELRAGDFDGLTNLDTLVIRNNGDLTALPSGIFDELSSLTALWLNNNGLTAIPADLLKGLSNLSVLEIKNNDLTVLPDGLFEGHSGFSELDLRGNDVNPLPLEVSLEFESEGTYKAVMPVGAPFNVTVTTTAVGGTIDGANGDLTIRPGKVKSSNSKSATRPEDEIAAVTVTISDVPGTGELPEDHHGIAVVASPNTPVEVIPAREPRVSIEPKTDGESVTEGTAATFIVTRESPTLAMRAYVSVSSTGDVLKTSDGYTTPDSVWFPRDTGTATLSVETQSDLIDEIDGAITVTVVSGDYDGYVVGTPASATITVLDDDVVPGAPTITSAAYGNQQAVIEWLAGPAGSSEVIAHEYQQRADAAPWGNWTPISDSAPTGTNATSYTVTGLSNGTEYTFRVRARNAVGVGAVSGEASDINSPPTFLTPELFEVDENKALSGAPIDDVFAFDFDPGDPVQSVSITGGDDMGKFELNSDGLLSFTTNLEVISFDAVLDYENPLDADGDGNFELVVTAISGEGLRTLSTELAVTVATNDVDEPPAAPGSPTVVAISATSLSVQWEEPTNAGSTITDYDVQYRAGTSGGFTDLTHSGAARSATISSLTANTAYQVQVRATSSEGTSDWSSSGSATTAEADQVTLLLTPSTIDESGDGNAATVSASISPAQTEAFTVTVSANAKSPAKSSDFTVSSNKTLSFAANATTSTGAVTITAVDNNDDASDREITVSGTVGGDGASGVTAPDSLTLTIADDEDTPNEEPFFDLSPEIEAYENDDYVSFLWAEDFDPLDEFEVSFRIVGGADRDLFHIVEGAYFGFDLKFKEPPDYERPKDLLSTFPANTAVNNEYVVVVVATSGVGERARTVLQTAIVTVTDDDEESPGRVDTPVVTAASPTSVTVTWNRPENSGPIIDDYDVQYRVGDTGSFTPWTHDGSNTSAVITGQSSNALIQVQVRAKSAEGTGEWSSTGSGRTEKAASQVEFVLTPSIITENGEVSTVTATLGLAVAESFTVTVAAEAIAPTTSSNFTLSNNTTLSFEANETTSTGVVTITAVDDTDKTPSKKVRITGTLSEGAQATAPTPTTLSITDDDTFWLSVCDRTPEIKEAILDEVTLATNESCSDVTPERMSHIDSLWMIEQGITSVKQGDFSGLSNLREINLSFNSLTSLPRGLLSDLPRLQKLIISSNPLSNIPADIFNDLWSLRNLNMASNQLGRLPSGLFSDNKYLRYLKLSGNQSLVLPPGIFDGLTQLEGLLLNRTVLPVALEQLSPGRFRASIAVGAPFTMVIPLSVTNGTLEDGATSITIPAGSVHSQPLTVTRNSAAAVSVDIESFPAVPHTHTIFNEPTYSFSKADGLPLEVLEALTDGLQLILSPDSIAESDSSVVTATLGTPVDTAFTLTVSASPKLYALNKNFRLSSNTTLSFAANSTRSTGEVTVSGVDNTHDDHRVKQLTISASVNGGPSDLYAPADTTLSITDDDPSPQVMWWASSSNFEEDGGAIEIRPFLNRQSSRTTTIEVRVSPAGEATTGDFSVDYPGSSATSYTYTFNPWRTSTSSNITLTPTNNDIVSPNRRVRITTTVTSENGVIAPVAELTIVDDEGSLPGRPSGITATAGDASVTVGWTPPADTAGIIRYQYRLEVDGSYNNFWTDIPDSAPDEKHASSYTVTGLVNGTNYRIRVRAVNASGVGESSGSATARPQAGLGPVVTVTYGAASYTATEAGTSAEVTVNLSSAPQQEVVIPITTSNVGSTSDADYSGVPESVTFSATETTKTFTVTATDDADDDDGESVTLGFGTLPESFLAGTQSTTTLSITDNDETTLETLVLNVDTIAGDDKVNIAEKAAGFNITGDTGSEGDVTVTVQVGSNTTLTATSADADPATWTVTMTANHAALTEGNVSVTVAAAKTGYASPSDVTRTLTVDLTVPTVPTYTVPGTLTVGTAIASMNPSSTSDIASFAAAGLPAGLDIDSGTGAISGTPTTANSSTTDVTVTVVDAEGNPATVEIEFPAVAKGDQTLSGFAYSAATATFGGEVPTLTAPSGAQTTLSYATNDEAVCTVDSGTGELTLTGSGTCAITATAASSDDWNQATATFTITVNALGTLALNVDAIAGDGTVNIAEKAAGFNITGDTGSEGDVTVTVQVGSSTTLTATSADADPATWTVAVAANHAALTEGNVPVTVAVAKTGYASPSDVTRTLVVDLTAPTAPTYTAPGTLTVGTTMGSMNPSSISDIATFSATNLPAGLGINAGTGVISGTPTTANSSTADVTVTVVDAAANEATANIEFPAVAKGDQTLTGFAYSAATVTFGGEVPTSTAPSGAQTTLSYASSDEAVCAVDSGTGDLTLTGAGTCTITATAASSDDWNEATATFTIAVNALGTLALNVDTIAGDGTVNIAEKAAGFNITGDTGSEGDVTVAVQVGSSTTLTATSADADPATWTVTMTANHAALTEGNVSVTVAAAKTGYTSPGDVTRTLTVDLTAPTAPSYTAPATLTVGTAISSMSPSSTSDIASFAAPGLPAGLVIDSGTGVISGTPTTAKDATTDVTVTVVDALDNPATVDIEFPTVAKGDQTLSGFEYSAATATIGGEVPTLTAPSGAQTTVSYASSDEAVCTVDSGTGEVTLTGDGDCVITATAQSSDNWNEATATFTLTVEVVISSLTNEIPAPTQLAAVGGHEQVSLTWNAPESAETITGYEFRFCRVVTPTVCEDQRATEDGEPGDWTPTDGANAHTVMYWYYVHNGKMYRFRLANGSTYRFQVRALAGDAEGEATEWVEGTPVNPSASKPSNERTSPSGFTATPGDAHVTLAWAAEQFDETVTTWQLRYGEFDQLDGSVAWGDWFNVDGASAAKNSYNVSNLVNGTQYGFQVRAMVGEVAGSAAEVTSTPVAPKFDRTEEESSLLSVADAHATAGTDATLNFVVSLNGVVRGPVTVDYTTVNGSAVKGDDYLFTSGTLNFSGAETSKTVEVPVLGDTYDEGSETIRFLLSRATGAEISDGEAIGTIRSGNSISRGSLARFGRTVTGQLMEAVETRLETPRESRSEAKVAGFALAPFRADDGDDSIRNRNHARGSRTNVSSQMAHASMTSASGSMGSDRGLLDFESLYGAGNTGRQGIGTRTLNERDFLAGSSFTLTGKTRGSGNYASFWGRGSIANFEGTHGDATLDGKVSTGLMGVDWARSRSTIGLALAHSVGTSGYFSDIGTGEMDATLTGLYPYVGLDLTDRLSVLAATGVGSGEVTLRPIGADEKTADLMMSMVATGVRGDVLKPQSMNGLTLSIVGDANFTQTSSELTSSADVWLVRTGIEGSRLFTLESKGGSASILPTIGIGVRRDGGDAETGMGADFSGSVVFDDPSHGLSLNLEARRLIVHEEADFQEWGASLAASWDPYPTSNRNLSVLLTQNWGLLPSSGMDSRFSHESFAELITDNDRRNRFEASSRLVGEVGYGFPVFGDLFTGTPNVGFGLADGDVRDWRIGWRLNSELLDYRSFQLSLDATWRESFDKQTPMEQGVMIESVILW